MMRRTCFYVYVIRMQIRCGNLNIPMCYVRDDPQVSVEVKSPKFNITSVWDLRYISCMDMKDLCLL